MKSRSQMRMEEHLKAEKPREFWILERGVLRSAEVINVPYGDERNYVLNRSDKWIWVIEKEAYDEALKEIARLKKESQELKNALERIGSGGW